jgi:DNA invertase Pin-like site-specific DNA recombinase
MTTPRLEHPVSTTPTVTIPGRRTRARKPVPATVAAGYLRVSTADQADSGLGLAAQRAAVERTAAREGVTIAGWFTDAAVSGTVAPDDRPGMAAALETLADHGAGVLIAAKIDRVSRSTVDSLQLADRAQREGWRLVTADGFDSGDDSPAARLRLSIQAAANQWERDIIAMRTREAMAALKAQGVQLGHPTTLSDAVLTRIITELSEGRSLRAIGQGLEADGIRTATGREHWHPQTVKQAANSGRAQAIVGALFGVQDADAPADAQSVTA